MIQHVVMWKLKDEAHGNNKEKNALLIKEMLENLRGKIDGLIEINVGIDIKINGNDDVVLVSVLKDEASLDVYQNHPLHQALLSFIRECCLTRHAVDYEF